MLQPSSGVQSISKERSHFSTEIVMNKKEMMVNMATSLSHSKHTFIFAIFSLKKKKKKPATLFPLGLHN